MKRRWLVGLAAVIASLSGCMTAQVSYEIVDDDRITYAATVGVNKDKAKYRGRDFTPESLCDSLSASIVAPTTRRPFTTDTQIGCTITASGKLSEFQSGEVVHEGGTYLVKVAGVSGVTAADIDSFAFSVRFPGAIVENRGDAEISGRTITWRNPDDYLSGRIGARAKDHRTPAATLAVAPLILITVLGVGIVVVIVRRVVR